MSIAATEQTTEAIPPRARGVSAPPRVDVLDGFEAARTLWRRLESEGVATPYNRFDWAEAYVRHVEAPSGGKPALIVIHDRMGDPALLLPLVVSSKGPLRVARFIGGKHANFNMPLLGPSATSIDASALRTALRTAGRAAGIDLYRFSAQPHAWEGVLNPMALLGGQASPSAGYKFALEADGEALLARRLSKDTRKKLRQKEARLAQIGPVAYVRPTNAEEARAMLEAFLRFKSQRFQSHGIDDPFAPAEVQAFLAEAVTPDPRADAPFIELHALKAGDRIVAVYGALRDRRRFCGLFTAFDSDPDIARSTPGDILLMAMIRQACRDGLTTFDLGVGEARYKMQVCDEREELFDSLIPVGLKGRIAALAFSQAIAAKRWAKASPMATRAIASLRRLRARG
jgi:CelD/BcsL family acetyltransferase involved in cellulose biosynthesis